jgi:hypothetical protein
MQMVYKLGYLPTTLKVLLDNTARENKNQYVCRYFAWMVAKGWFDFTQIDFLMAGHTHGEQDQLFASFADALRRRDFVRAEELWDILRREIQ